MSMAKAKLGTGARFATVGRAAAASGARNPAAVAAAAGRKKYGAKKMAKLSAAGRRRKTRWAATTLPPPIRERYSKAIDLPTHGKSEQKCRRATGVRRSCGSHSGRIAEQAR